MAKVRIQAGRERDEDEVLPVSNGDANSRRLRKEKGAVGILTDEYNERGFSGWYQVNYIL